MGDTSSRSAAWPSLFLILAGCAHTALRTEPSGPGKSGETSRPAIAEALDSSEVMTPEELATIPEPVPPESGGPPTTVEPRGELRLRTEEESPEAAGGAQPAPMGVVWRVQIFASSVREEAQRVAREAESRLGVAATIEVEGALYKVRLGAFSSEEDAQTLRERAIEAGYVGAFRARVISR